MAETGILVAVLFFIDISFLTGNLYLIIVSVIVNGFILFNIFINRKNYGKRNCLTLIYCFAGRIENVFNTSKAHPAYFDSYSRFDEVKAYLDQFNNIICVGRNGQHRYNNMDHSMITAFNAVEFIETDEKNHYRIWNVNTEKEYHEGR